MAADPPIATGGTPFETPTCVGAWIEYPFRDQGDSSTRVYHHDMRVRNTAYVPLNDDDQMTDADEKPIRSPFSDDSNAFYVGDTPPQPQDGGMVGFVRSFANIPAVRVIDNGLYGFSFPENDNTSVQYEVSGSPSFSISGSVGSWQVDFTLGGSDEDQFEVGDRMTIDYGISTGTHFLVTYSGSGDTNPRPSALRWIIIDKDPAGGGNFNFEARLEFAYAFTSIAKGTSTTWSFFRNFAYGRSQQQTINAASRREYRYVKKSHGSTVVLADKFFVTDDNYRIISSLGQNSQPTAKEYMGQVSQGQYILAEPENQDQWRGNIYEIESVLVKAQ